MIEEFYLVRHALTESNKKKIYAGWSEETICKEGIRISLEVASKLKRFNIEKIYSSPLRRAVQTAEIINRFINKDIELEEDLKEMKMGPWEGLSEQEVAEKFPVEWKIWNSEPSKLKLYGRETLRELQLRALKAKEKIAAKSRCSRILAVTHVALIRVLIVHYNNLSQNKYRNIDVPNLSVYFLDNRAKKKKIIRIL